MNWIGQLSNKNEEQSTLIGQLQKTIEENEGKLNEYDTLLNTIHQLDVYLFFLFSSCQQELSSQKDTNCYLENELNRCINDKKDYLKKINLFEKDVQALKKYIHELEGTNYTLNVCLYS